MNVCKLIVILFFLLSLNVLCSLGAQNALREQFAHPPAEAKPWTFWYWMFGSVSKEGIQADLEAMQRIGLGGAYLMPIKSPEQGVGYPEAIKQLSPEWWELVRYSMEQADRLGLKLGMHICDGFALAGGPWITPRESMQKVVWSDTIISGGAVTELPVAYPQAYEGYYEDIALLALPVLTVEEEAIPCITSNHPDNPFPFSSDKDAFRASKPCWIQYEYSTPFTLRNVEVVLTGNNYQAHRLLVMASDDGVDFRRVKQLIPARQGWQNTDQNSTHTVPPTTARYFRFYWTPEGSEPGCEDMDAAKWKPNLKIDRLLLSSTPRLNQWEGKAGLVWRVAPRTTDDEVGQKFCVAKEQVINLTSSLKKGLLTTHLPQGKWRILRMGHTSTGHTNATGGAGKGLECDKFSEAAVKKQFDHWFGLTFEKTDPILARRVLKYMHVDSWECGSQNWSSNFAFEFRTRRGYDLMPYLPLLAGIPMESSEVSENILRDVRTTISELVLDVFYKVLAVQAKQYDCQFSAECVSPTMVSDGLLHYQAVDRPMGEFWLQSPTHDKPNDMLDAISGAHIYGKNIIQAEGFTQLRTTWNEHPALLKPLLDRNYALGVNKLFYHVYVHNPYLERAPGMTLDGIGLYFQRNQTWWEQGKAFVTYAARCQALLQYGHPVTDIAVFTGEEIPRRALLPDRLLSSLPGIFGAERVESERIRLANTGQPLRAVPAGVNHSANTIDPEKWINPLRGYAYDSFNRDALLRLARAEKGRMVLPGGASYKVLILPLPHPMSPDRLSLSPEVQAKVDELKQAGVLIPSVPYCADDFSADGLERDLIVPGGIAWTHRCGKEADVYFIANQEACTRIIDLSIRISGRSPELWNPVTGEITVPQNWSEEKGRTLLTLTLAPNESTFIVFGKLTTASLNCKKRGERLFSPLVASQWQITFSAIRKTLTRSELFDWSKEADEAIRYYSGTAFYQTTFHWKKRKGDKRIYLYVGKLSVMATVRVNGMDCGTVWTSPYSIEITKALKKGNNTLEIEVVNTWANAINGSDKGKPPFSGIWTNAKYRMNEDVLLEAGLLGPLELSEE